MKFAAILNTACLDETMAVLQKKKNFAERQDSTLFMKICFVNAGRI